jgi:Flp pilus assembly pilin Flp
MKTQQLRKNTKGQGLVEYALILSLVALVTIVVTFLLGQAAQRVYGVTAGALGAKYNASGAETITITSAQCIAEQSSNRTGMWVLFESNVNPGDLIAGTDKIVDGMIANGAAINSHGAGYTYNPLLSDSSADTGLCPKAVTIQTKSGAIAVAPVEVVYY